MHPPMRRKVADQVLIQLIEADVDMGFALIDEARSYHASGQAEISSRALQEAAKVIADIERRLRDLGHSESEPFLPLVAELRNEMEAAQRESN